MRVKEMQAMGITVSGGQGCVLVTPMTHRAAMARCFPMVSERNPAIMGLQGYGLKVHDQASPVVLDAGNPVEALRLPPDRLEVVSKG